MEISSLGRDVRFVCAPPTLVLEKTNPEIHPRGHVLSCQHGSEYKNLLLTISRLIFGSRMVCLSNMGGGGMLFSGGREFFLARSAAGQAKGAMGTLRRMSAPGRAPWRVL